MSATVASAHALHLHAAPAGCKVRTTLHNGVTIGGTLTNVGSACFSVRLHDGAIRTVRYVDVDHVIAPAREKECGFCGGKPVGNAARWSDGNAPATAPCPRCGK